MADFGDIPPVNSPWPIKPLKDLPERRHPSPGEGQDEQSEEEHSEEPDHEEPEEDRPKESPPDDGLPHVDEYA